MSKTLCWGMDKDTICYWQKRFWQAFKMLTLEQREELANSIGEEE